MSEGKQSSIRVSTSDSGVTTITLARPESRNAMNQEMVRQLLGAMRSADEDEAIKAIVLTGDPPVFCAGADLKEVAASSSAEMEARVDLSTRLYGEFRRLRVPVLAAVNGHALAGGCGLAMSCDLTIADESAEFGYPEIQRGLVAALVMVSLSRVVPSRAALELLLTGRRVAAEEALSLGMVNRVVPAGTALDVASGLATTLASFDADAMRITKQLFYRVLDTPFESAIEQARLTNLVVRRLDRALAGARSFSDRNAE